MQILTKQGKLVIYNSFFYFSYCPLAWHFCSASGTNKLERIQERALRFISNDYTSSLGALLIATNTQPLHIRRLEQMACEVFILASHCPEVDTRWSYECGILNFARNSSRTLTSANQQQKSLRCLPKVTRLHSNTTRRYQEGITKAIWRCDFKYDIYTKAIRRSHDAVRRLHGVVL